MKILISGTTSGLGKYLLQKFIGEPYIRNDNKIINKKYDIIIHCAYNSSNNVRTSELNKYLNDTIFLTKKLTKIKHHYFIFISTIDVYSKKKKIIQKESDLIYLNEINNIYGISKLMCEDIVNKNTKKCLILRPGFLVGKSLRNSSIKKIINSEKNVSLDGKSNFYCISYYDIWNIIKICHIKQISGVLNVFMKPGFTLEELSDIYYSKTKFGKFLYQSPQISNFKLKKLYKKEMKSSIEVIKTNINCLKI